jgi:hypothetical protein
MSTRNKIGTNVRKNRVNKREEKEREKREREIKWCRNGI